MIDSWELDVDRPDGTRRAAYGPSGPLALIMAARAGTEESIV